MGLASLEAEVETLDRVGEGTNRDEVYALLGIVADGIVGDAAAHKEWVRTEGLCAGRLIVTDDKIYVPGSNTVVVGVKHEL